MAYGFDADRLLVWLAAGDPGGDPLRAGALCQRHADAMVVPRGWTLDDRREATPRLFRPAPVAGHTAAAARRAKATGTPVEQLALADVDTATPPGPATVAAVTGTSAADDDPDATAAIPWLPTTTTADDDLGGTLAADSPLLARAFRGTDRPR